MQSTPQDVNAEPSELLADLSSIPRFRLYEATKELALSEFQRSANYYMGIINTRIYAALVVAPLIRMHYRYVNEHEIHMQHNMNVVLPAGAIVEKDFGAAYNRTAMVFPGYKSAGVLSSGVVHMYDWVHMVPVCPSRAGRPARRSQTKGDPELKRLGRSKYFKPTGASVDVGFGWAAAILKHQNLDPYVPFQYYPRSFDAENMCRVVTNAYYFGDSTLSGVRECWGHDALFDRGVFLSAPSFWYWGRSNTRLTVLQQNVAADQLAVSGRFDGRLEGNRALYNSIPFGWVNNIGAVASALGENVESVAY